MTSPTPPNATRPIKSLVGSAGSLDIHPIVRLVLGEIHAPRVVVACSLRHRHDRQAKRDEKDEKEKFDLHLSLHVIFLSRCSSANTRFERSNLGTSDRASPI